MAEPVGRPLHGHRLLGRVDLELHHRRRLGESPQAQEYRSRFPAQAEVVDTAFAFAQEGATPGGHAGSTGPFTDPEDNCLR
jgi:hypothetical protein